jgi:hypothetical protein
MPYDFDRQDNILADIAASDCKVLAAKDRSYDGSWRKRGGMGAFMMLARKWDRLESIAQKAQRQYAPIPLDLGDGKKRETYSGYVHSPYDIFGILASEDSIGQGGNDGSLLAEIRDLRRYLMLVEAYMTMTCKQPYKPDPIRVELPKTVKAGDIVKLDDNRFGVALSDGLHEGQPLVATKGHISVRVTPEQAARLNKQAGFPLYEEDGTPIPAVSAHVKVWGPGPDASCIPLQSVPASAREATAELRGSDPDAQMEHAAANAADREAYRQSVQAAKPLPPFDEDKSKLHQSPG